MRNGFKMYNPAAILKRTIFNRNRIWIIIGFFIAVIMGVAIGDTKWIYMGAVIAPFLIYLCIEKPFIFPFGAYVFLIPFDSVLSVVGSSRGTTLTKLLGIITIFIFFLKGIFENKLIKPDSASIWLLLLILYSLLSVWWAIKPELVLNLFPTAVGLLLLYLIVASYKIERHEFETVKWFILIGGFMAALYTIYIYLKGHFYFESERAALVVGERAEDPNYFVYTLIIPISICIQKMLSLNRVTIKVLFGFVLSVMIFCVIITSSRSGSIAVLTVVFTYFFLIKKRTTFIAIIFICGIVLMQFIPELFFERIHDAVETKGIGRTHLLYVGWKALEKYWLVGAGIGNFGKAFTEFIIYDPNFHDLDRGAHNLFLASLVELGILGITLLIVIIAKHYRILKMRFSHGYGEDIMLKATFWGILTMSFFLDPMFRKSFWLLWMMIVMEGNLSKRGRIK
jgi:hypothetical protein